MDPLQTFQSIIYHPITIFVGGGIAVNLASVIVQKLLGGAWGSFSKTQKAKNTRNARRDANLMTALSLSPELREAAVIDMQVATHRAIFWLLVSSMCLSLSGWQFPVSTLFVSRGFAFLTAIAILITMVELTKSGRLYKKLLDVARKKRRTVSQLLGRDSDAILQEITHEVASTKDFTLAMLSKDK